MLFLISYCYYTLQHSTIGYWHHTTVEVVEISICVRRQYNVIKHREQ